MNISTQTGKPWVNNYMQMIGTLSANQNHKYIQLYRYFDVISKLEGRAKAAYAMILHQHLANVTCNRAPGVRSNIFMYIDNEQGSILNSKDMKAFMEKTGWMNCEGQHLLKIASPEVWWLVFKAMLELGLINVRSGMLRVMYPIEGRFLPIPYAYVAFLSRVKKDNTLSKSILESMAKTPQEIRTNLESLTKEDLINEFIKLKTQNLQASKSNPIYQLLFDEVQAKYPHSWGTSQEKNRLSFIEKIMENISENNPEKISEKISGNFSGKNPEKKPENIPGINSPKEIANKIQEYIPEKKEPISSTKILPVDELHNFERTDIRTRKVKPKPNQEYQITIEDTIFYAEGTTHNDLKKIQKVNPEIFFDDNSENISDSPENDLDKFNTEDLPSIDSITDIFGLEIDSDDLSNIPEIPHIAERVTDGIPDVGEDFW